MDLNLTGQTALITGGSKGIGRAVAERFAAEGCDLHLVARTKADLDTTKAVIEQAHGVAVTTHALDLSTSRNVDHLAEVCAQVPIVVNNAGAIPAGNVAAVDEARWRAAWDLKVFGYVNMTRAFLALMAARGQGVIVNVIGLAGEKPDAGYVAGSAGNASLMAFTRAVGGTSLETGVRVVAVNPGAVETDRLVTLMRTRAADQFGDAERWRELLSRLPLGRAATVEEVADMVVFLASERAAYISGTVITIDGGHAARGSAT